MQENRKSPRQITLCAYTRFEGQRLHATVVPVGDAFVPSGSAVDIRVWHRSQRRPFVRTRIDDFEQPSGRTVVLDLGQVPAGSCDLQAVFIDRWGRECPTRLIQSADPPQKPEWWGSRAGLDPGVPASWTPLQITSRGGGQVVSCWGRRYRFAPGCLIESVITTGSPVLDAPVCLAGAAGGRSLRFVAGGIDRLAADAGEVVLEQRMTAASLDVHVQAQIDFDGMVRFDVEVSPADTVDLDSLSIEIPVRAEYAKYLYHFPGAWGTARNAGALPADPVRMGFRPYIWLGDDDRGLAWFSESDRDWHVAPGTPGTEIVRAGDRVVLTLHLISAPMRLAPESRRPVAWNTAPELENAVVRDAAITGERAERYQPLRYTFGLQATPVKADRQQGAWDRRLIHVGPEPPGTGFTAPLTLEPWFLDRCADAGVRTVVLHEFWTDIESHTIPVDRDRLHELVGACHDRGLRILLYYGFLISSQAPEWRDFAADCLTMPRYGYPVFHAGPQPDQSAWVVCLNSAWQDFVADAIAKAMDEYGIDGVYLDGTEFPAGCINTLHGCGSMRPDGSIAKSYPIFGVRSAMRRIHNAVKRRDPEAQINVHNSTCMVMPTLGFGTSYWDGEQFQDVRGSEDAATQLPLDAFRTEFMGRQWGVPAEFLCYGQGFTYEQAWAITLIHDVPVRPLNRHGLEELDLASRIWRLMDDFGRGRAEWLPYWRNQEHVRADSSGIYVSLYRHPDNGALAVVSNLNRARTPFALTVNWRLLGLDRPRVSIIDAFDRSAAPLHGELDPYAWRLLWFRPEAG